MHKNLKKMRKSKILFFFTTTLFMCSCGSTKVVVDKPASGTQTTITVTTNNPITTDVNPNVELKNTK